MKKTKRLLTIWVAVALMVCMSLSFVGCKEEEPIIGPIPNGRYVPMDETENGILTYVYAENSERDYYWEIEGDETYFVASGLITDRAKIVERDDKIYFEGYKWRDIILDLGALLMRKKPTPQGNANIYIVEYKTETRSITVELYQKGE